MQAVSINAAGYVTTPVRYWTKFALVLYYMCIIGPHTIKSDLYAGSGSAEILEAGEAIDESKMIARAVSFI